MLNSDQRAAILAAHGFLYLLIGAVMGWYGAGLLVLAYIIAFISFALAVHELNNDNER